jgi:hypothetical protein
MRPATSFSCGIRELICVTFACRRLIPCVWARRRLNSRWEPRPHKRLLPPPIRPVRGRGDCALLRRRVDDDFARRLRKLVRHQLASHRQDLLHVRYRQRDLHLSRRTLSRPRQAVPRDAPVPVWLHRAEHGHRPRSALWSRSFRVGVVGFMSKIVSVVRCVCNVSPLHSVARELVKNKK